MPENNQTKLLLAASFMSLLKDKPIEKIYVADICAACGVNRKSFYYHFRDKFDLANWIFDTDTEHMLRSASDRGHVSAYAGIDSVCRYIWDNSEYYKRLFAYHGQNSFSEHLRCVIRPYIKEVIIGAGKVDPESLTDFTVDFYTDAWLVALQRRLGEDRMTCDEFIAEMRQIACRT